MTIDINFGYNTEDKKLDGPNFNKSTGFKKGISNMIIFLKGMMMQMMILVKINTYLKLVIKLL